MIDLGRSCTKHRPALIDFVDRGEIGPSTAAAMAHLDRCERCTAAVESTVLTITALRRYADTLDAAEPSPDSWPRLAARISGWRRPSLAMSPLTGVAMSLAIAAVIVLPFRLGPADLGGTRSSDESSFGNRPTSSEPAAIRVADRFTERPIRAGDRASSADEIGAQRTAGRMVVGDDVVMTTKEVAQAKATTRPALRI